MARPRTKSKEELRANDRERRKRFVEKKRESGLRELKVYLDEESLNALDRLCKEMGYLDAAKGARENRGDVLSNVVGYCIRQTAGCTKGKLPQSTLSPRLAHSIFSTMQILKYRKNEKGETDFAIARFMNKYEYPKLAPQKLKTGATTEKWSGKDVEYALEPKNYRRLLNPK